MKRFIAPCLLLISFSLQVFAQASMPANLRATNTIARLSDINGMTTSTMLFGIPPTEGKVIGDAYLSLDWKRTSIQLYEGDKVLPVYPARLDVHANELEVKATNGIKALPGNKVRNFLWLDSITQAPTYFINAKEFKSTFALDGFLEILVDGKMALLKKTNVMIKKADFNVALNMGHRDDRILREDLYYYAQGNQLAEVPTKKKQFMLVFGDQANRIERFIDDNSFSIKNERHLQLVFQKYNSFVKD